MTASALAALAGVAMVAWSTEDRYSRSQLEAAVQQVVANAPEWRERGIAVSGAYPRRDRKGIVVMVERLHPDTERRLDAHYAVVTVFAEERSIVVPTVSGPGVVILLSGDLEPPKRCESVRECVDGTWGR